MVSLINNTFKRFQFFVFQKYLSGVYSVFCLECRKHMHRSVMRDSDVMHTPVMVNIVEIWQLNIPNVQKGDIEEEEKGFREASKLSKFLN